MHLGIDFWSILMDFGSQVGGGNRPKIDQKRHRKNDPENNTTKMAQKRQQGAAALLHPTDLGPRGGGRGRGKPLPGGMREGVDWTIVSLKPPVAQGLVGFLIIMIKIPEEIWLFDKMITKP